MNDQGSDTGTGGQTWFIVKFKVATCATALSNSDVKSRDRDQGTTLVLYEESHS